MKIIDYFRTEYIIDAYFFRKTGHILTNKNEIFLDDRGLKKILKNEGDIVGKNILVDEKNCQIQIGKMHKFRRGKNPNLIEK